MCHPSQTPGLPVSCTIANENETHTIINLIIPRGRKNWKGERTPQKKKERNDLQTPSTQMTQSTDLLPRQAQSEAVARHCALKGQGRLSNSIKSSKSENVNSYWIIPNKERVMQYHKLTVSQPNRQVAVFHGRTRRVLPLTIFAMPTRWQWQISVKLKRVFLPRCCTNRKKKGHQQTSSRNIPLTEANFVYSKAHTTTHKV